MRPPRSSDVFGTVAAMALPAFEVTDQTSPPRLPCTLAAARAGGSDSDTPTATPAPGESALRSEGEPL